MIKLYAILLLITGPYCIDINQSYTAFNVARSYYAKAGFSLRMKRFYTIPDPCPQYNTLDTRYEKLVCLIKLTTVKYPSNSHFHYIAPPMFENGVSYIAGYSGSVCGRRTVSLSNAIEYNVPKHQYRLDASALAIAHELGHVFGASDIGGETLMNTGALGMFITGKNLEFSAYSIRQIRNCQKSYGLRCAKRLETYGR